ncbi:MAG: baseplate J/gp47 family protein, partial [Beijerinckiaceae bacterium]
SLLEGHIEKLALQTALDWDVLPCDTLYANGAKIGLPLRGATYAFGWAKLTGDAETEIPANLTFAGPGSYVIDTGRVSPAALDENGEATVPIIATEPGAIGNAKSATGVLGENVEGIDTYVPFVTATGGTDAETCESYRARLKFIDMLDKTPGSSGWHAFRLMRYPGVTRVCIDPCNCCDGLIRLFIFADGLFERGIPDQAFLDLVQGEVFDKKIGTGPYASKLLGLTGEVAAATPAAVDIRVSCSANVTLNQQAAAKAEVEAVMASLCPGAPVCKATLTNAVLLRAGCVGSLEFTVDDQYFEQDCANLSPKCGVLPVMGNFCFSNGLC